MVSYKFFIFSMHSSAINVFLKILFLRWSIQNQFVTMNFLQLQLHTTLNLQRYEERDDDIVLAKIGQWVCGHGSWDDDRLKLFTAGLGRMFLHFSHSWIMKYFLQICKLLTGHRKVLHYFSWVNSTCPLKQQEPSVTITHVPTCKF